LLLVSAFVANAALEAALSFGAHGHRLSAALSRAAFHAMIMFAMAMGYAVYKLVTSGAEIRMGRAVANTAPRMPVLTRTSDGD
jgi:hypothetical protein